MSAQSKPSPAEDWLHEHAAELPEEDLHLLARAQRTLLANVLEVSATSTDPLPWHPWRGICPSVYSYRGIWNWDSAFHAVGVSRWDPALAREQIHIFLERQLPSGLLPDVIYEDGTVLDAYGKPPVMPWAAVCVDRRDPDDEFLSLAYDRFVRYERHWARDRGGDEHGLFHYDSNSPDPEERLTQAKWESGWDDSVRWDDGIFEVWPIDLNCFMVMAYRSLATMAERLSLPGDRQGWQARERELADRINERLYDGETHAYLDYDFSRQRFVPALTPASFMPLYVGIAPSERAGRMAHLAVDSDRFHPGWPTVSYDHPCYANDSFWRGPTWLNVAYFALKGLKTYGFDRIADVGRATLLEWCRANPDYIYEYYDSRSGRGLGAPQFSWSAVFIMEFLLNWDGG